LKFVELGRVAKPHGIRGEVKVRLHWGQSQALQQAENVLVLLADAECARPMRVQACGRLQGGLRLKLEGVDDRDAAAALRGAAVGLDRDSLPPPGAGEYYLADLVGARVVAHDGEVGDVIEIRVHPTVDTLVIRACDGRELEQVLDAAWVEEVDVAHKLVRLSSRDGLV